MFKKVKPYIGEYGRYTTLASVLMSIGILANVLPYLFLYQLLKPLTLGQGLTPGYIALRVLAIAVCEIIYALLYTRGLIYSHVSAYNTLKNLRISLQQKLEAQPLGNILELGNGRIKKIFNDDIDQIELLLAHAIPEGIANIAIPLLVLIAMFIFDIRLGLLSLIPLIVGILSMGMMMKAGYALMGDYYASAAAMNNMIIEYVNGMEVVKVFNKDGESYKKYKNDVEKYRDFTIRWYKMCWPWMAAYTSIIPCICMFILPIGSMMVLNGTITLDKLILVLCMSFSVGPALLKALNFAGKIPQLDYKITELENLLSHPPLKSSGNKFTGNDLDITFDNVHFSYEEDEVLHGVSARLEKGTTTALVGESGSGKSTLAKLLVHYYDIAEGSISIGGQDITDMSLEELNDKVAYVAQEQFLFNTTLYENILIGNPDATREDVLKAAERAQCMEFLDKLPLGLDTNAGDGGKMLSGGERQRIALARALLKDAPIVVLDEATAFIDPENEEKMNAAIDEIMKDKTVLIIAHRLETIKNASQILVMKEGNCIASGNHDELTKTCDEYRKLWEANLSAVNWKIGGVA